MGKELLARFYRVGFGDCIYLEVPDQDETFTILIDCGTSASAGATLRPALEHIRSSLPGYQAGKPRLDLLIVTHPHADHLKGFDPAWFKGITIGRIWLSSFMKPDHPQAQLAHAFEAAVDLAARFLLDRPGLNLSLGADSLLRRSLSNPGALAALRKGLPTTNGRLYVARDIAGRLSKEEREQHHLSLENGVTCFRGFLDKHTCIRILAPEWDIDGTYLGQEDSRDNAILDPLLVLTEAYERTSGNGGLPAPGGSESKTGMQVLPNPSNISERDFRLLRSNLLYTAIAFSQEDDALKNNVSVVLLLEWCGRRLLFTGDAEWDGSGIQKGQRNSSWDVMLGNKDVKDMLLKPLDLFKVAHHGSHNGTPFDRQGTVKILPEMVTPERTHVVVSTVVGVHGKKNPVPYAPLMTELGRLAANKQTYPECEPELKGIPQPRRTDLESDSTESGVEYLEVVIKPDQ